MRAIRGDLPRGSPQLQEALAGARMTNATRRRLLHRRRSRVWRTVLGRMEAAFVPLTWKFSCPLKSGTLQGGLSSSNAIRRSSKNLGSGEHGGHEKACARTRIWTTGIEVTTPPPPEDVATNQM